MKKSTDETKNFKSLSELEKRLDDERTERAGREASLEAKRKGAERDKREAEAAISAALNVRDEEKYHAAKVKLEVASDTLEMCETIRKTPYITMSAEEYDGYVDAIAKEVYAALHPLELEIEDMKKRIEQLLEEAETESQRAAAALNAARKELMNEPQDGRVNYIALYGRHIKWRIDPKQNNPERTLETIFDVK